MIDTINNFIYSLTGAENTHFKVFSIDINISNYFWSYLIATTLIIIIALGFTAFLILPFKALDKKKRKWKK